LERSDAELVARTLEGDTRAFAELVARYGDAAYGIGLHFTGDPHEAAQVAQNAFLRAWRGLPGLREPGKFAAWLCAIARNVARDRLAARAAASEHCALEEVPEMEGKAGSPAREARSAEVVRTVRRLMEDLPDEQRLAFTLFYVDGYSYSDLSSMLQVPEGTIKARLSRTRAKLRKGVVKMARDAMQESKPDAQFWRSATGSVSGKVTSSATGDPVEGCRVQLDEARTQAAASTISDADGAWEVEGLMPGAYAVSAQRDEFVPQRYEANRYGMLGRTSVIVRPGQSVQGIDFELQPGAFIKGTALDARGAPVADAKVVVYSEWGADNEVLRFRSVPEAHSQTDADGQFRAGPLEEGAYLVGVRVGGRDDWGPHRPACFYPGIYSLHDAEWLEASAGSASDEVMIRMPERGTTELRVRVTQAESGAPIGGARVLVIRRDAFVAWFTGVTDEAGLFRSGLLTRGPWQVTAGAPEQGYARWSKWIDVGADDSDVEVGLELARGAVFKGRVVTKDTAELPALGSLECYFRPPGHAAEGHPICSWQKGGRHYWWQVKEGPQQEKAGPDDEGIIVSPPIWPGQVMISADMADSTWRVTRISVDGRPLSKGAINCASGECVDTLQIGVATNLGIVAGRIVRADAKTPVPGAWAHIERRDEAPIHVARVETDQTGSFLIHGVPAGPYSVRAERSSHPGVHEGAKREITVEPDQVVHVDLILAEQ
jgi:RNA polymerase sigma-70 factor (ECF subfamily)